MSTTKGKFAIQKIYIKDVSFETPASPMIFKQDWKPEVDMDIQNHWSAIKNDLYEVVLNVTVTVRLETTVAYLVEIQQAGIFMVKGIPEPTLDQVLNTTCANILFPFSREFIAEMVSRAGFPQFLIQPVNFDALYHLQKKDQSPQQVEKKTGKATVKNPD